MCTEFHRVFETSTSCEFENRRTSLARYHHKRWMCLRFERLLWNHIKFQIPLELRVLGIAKKFGDFGLLSYNDFCAGKILASALLSNSKRTITGIFFKNTFKTTRRDWNPNFLQHKFTMRTKRLREKDISTLMYWKLHKRQWRSMSKITFIEVTLC